jgi:hypothetical protein
LLWHTNQGVDANRLNKPAKLVREVLADGSYRGHRANAQKAVRKKIGRSTINSIAIHADSIPATCPKSFKKSEKTKLNPTA